MTCIGSSPVHRAPLISLPSANPKVVGFTETSRFADWPRRKKAAKRKPGRLAAPGSNPEPVLLGRETGKNFPLSETLS
jgi:hypothetical protein